MSSGVYLAANPGETAVVFLPDQPDPVTVPIKAWRIEGWKAYPVMVSACHEAWVIAVADGDGRYSLPNGRCSLSMQELQELAQAYAQNNKPVGLERRSARPAGLAGV
jgi:hypothetical protein